MSSSSSSEFSNLLDEKSASSSPVHVSSVESSEEEHIERIDQAEPSSSTSSTSSWPKYKHFKDPQTGEEAIYVLLPQPPHQRHHHHHKPARKDEAWMVCRQLLDLSSISLFVASNLLAFTVGLLIGKRSVEF